MRDRDPAVSDSVKRRVREQFGASADAYARSDIHARGESLQVLIDEVGPRPEWQALDVATGAGHCALAFAPLVRGVVGVDLTEEMLRTAARLASERGLGNISTRRGDAEALPCEDETFDLVTCRLAFHHFPEPLAAAREFARVLRPDGRLGFTDNIVVAEPQAAEHYNAYERLRDPSHHEVLPLARLVDLIESAGLHVTVLRRLTKEFEFHDWCDRQNVSPANRERLIEMLQRLPPALAPLLAPRQANGTHYFTLWEAVIVAVKP